MTQTMTKYFPDYDLARDIGADGFTPSIKVEEASRYTFQVNFEFGGGTSAGTVSLQYSLDGINFGTDSDSSLSFDNTLTEPFIIRVVLEADKWVRLKFDNVSGSGGVANTLFYYKFI